MFQLDKKHQKYEKYNPTNIDWIGDIPDGWEVQKLKYGINRISRGISPDYSEDDTGIKVINQACVYWDGINTKNIKYDKNIDLIKERGLLKLGDLLMNSTGRGTLGRIAYFNLEEQYIADSHITIIRTKKNILNSNFLLYLFSTDLFQEYIYSTCVSGSTNQIELSGTDMKDIPIIYPDTKEQKQITDYLDEKTALLDEAIVKKKKQIELLAEHRTALINDAITKGLDKNVEMKNSGIEWIGEIPKGWEVKKMKYLASVCNGSDYKEIEVQDGKYSVFGSGGEFARTNTYVFNKPSVLLGRKGTIDKPLFVIEPFWTVDTMFYTKIFNNTYPKFFYYQCLNINFKEHQSGSALPSMTQGILLNIHFPTPKLQEQKEIADYLDKETKYIDDMIAKIEKSIELLEEYKTSLISHAVSGKIRVS